MPDNHNQPDRGEPALFMRLFHTSEAEVIKGRSKLEGAIHQLLVVGVILSSILMLTGFIMELVINRRVPEQVPDLNQVITLALALQPSGILALGLLVLIATPILRVAASVIGYLYERDWRFAVITFIVLMIVIFSITVGGE